MGSSSSDAASPGPSKGDSQLFPPAEERASQTFPAAQYRAKAAEFRALLTITPRSANETKELGDLAETYTTLAENEEWMAANIGKLTQRRRNYDNRTVFAEEEEEILTRLGAALLMRWNTVPTKLQRELFDCAGNLDDLQQSKPVRERIARFLHNHKNDQQRSE